MVRRTFLPSAKPQLSHICRVTEKMFSTKHHRYSTKAGWIAGCCLRSEFDPMMTNSNVASFAG